MLHQYISYYQDKIHVLMLFSENQSQTTIYQDVSKRAIDGKMEANIYMDLIEAIAECDFRIREGANPRIQLEALLTKFL